MYLVLPHKPYASRNGPTEIRCDAKSTVRRISFAFEYSVGSVWFVRAVKSYRKRLHAKTIRFLRNIRAQMKSAVCDLFHNMWLCTHKNFEMFSKHFLFELNCATSSRDDPFQHSRRSLAAFAARPVRRQACSHLCCNLLATLIIRKETGFYTYTIDNTVLPWI